MRNLTNNRKPPTFSDVKDSTQNCGTPLFSKLRGEIAKFGRGDRRKSIADTGRKVSTADAGRRESSIADTGRRESSIADVGRRESIADAGRRESIAGGGRRESTVDAERRESDDDLESEDSLSSEDSPVDNDSSTSLTESPSWSSITEEAPTEKPAIVPEPPKQSFVQKCQCPKADFVHLCFFFLNFIFLVFGTTLLAFGILVVTNSEDINNFTKNFLTGRLANVDFAGVFRGASDGLIISGITTFLIGCLGIVGIGIGSMYILYVYGGLICAAIGTEVMACLVAFILRDSIFKDIKDSLLENMESGYDGRSNSTSLFSQSLDAAQVYFECCGINDWRDFELTPWYRRVNNIPDSTPPSEIPCIYVNVTNNATGNSSSLYDNVTRTPDAILTTCIYVINTTMSTTPDPNATMVTPSSGLLLFPKTCCKATRASVISVAGEGALQLLDPKCPFKNASISNPNTAVGCFNTVKSWLFNQIIVILSLVFTVIGVEVSAVSNTYSVIKNLKKKAEKAKLISIAMGSGAIPGTASFGAASESGFPVLHPRQFGEPQSPTPKSETSSGRSPADFQSSLAAYMGGEYVPPEDQLEPDSESSLSTPSTSPASEPAMPMTTTMLVMGPSGVPQLTLVTLPARDPAAGVPAGYPPRTGQS